MKVCSKCMKKIKTGEEQKMNRKVFCEDCFIDALTPQMKKTYYENDKTEFMRRLMGSYSVNKQKYH